MNTAAIDVLDFWFGATDDPGHAEPRKTWFTKDAAFDAEISRRFGPLIEQALAGELDDWLTQPIEPLPALALVILLDQFTRNTLRDTPRAFAGDARALRAATAMVGSRQDEALPPVQRAFVYLPFEHAEGIAMQDEAVRLFTRLAVESPALDGMLDYAHKHRVVVQRFGRFPHRNAILGRLSTAEEEAFLREPGSRF